MNKKKHTEIDIHLNSSLTIGYFRKTFGNFSKQIVFSINWINLMKTE